MRLFGDANPADFGSQGAHHTDGAFQTGRPIKNPPPNPSWLPAPKRPFNLCLRLYWPKATPPSILPLGEGTWKPPAVGEVIEIPLGNLRDNRPPLLLPSTMPTPIPPTIR